MQSPESIAGAGLCILNESVAIAELCSGVLAAILLSTGLLAEHRRILLQLLLRHADFRLPKPDRAPVKNQHPTSCHSPIGPYALTV